MQGAKDSANQTLHCTKGSHSERPLLAVQTRMECIEAPHQEGFRRIGLCTCFRFAIGDNGSLGSPQTGSFCLRMAGIVNVNMSIQV
jgi:hypothetical protein